MTNIEFTDNLNERYMPKFGDLKINDYFVYGNFLYVKIENIDGVNNALNVKTASTCLFGGEESVEPVKKIQIIIG